MNNTDEKNDIKVSIEISQLTDKLFEVIEIFKEDRKMAKKNYEDISFQLDKITEIAHMSEDAKLEKEKNIALKLVFDSASRLEMVVKTLTEILINQMNAESRERIAKHLASGSGDPNKQIPNGAIDLTKIPLKTKQQN